MAEVKGALADDKFPWYISYDNVNIPFRVFSQRLENQGEFGNGTAATVYVKPDGKPLSNHANQDLREKRAAGAQRPLTEMDITRLAMDSHHDIQEHVEYHVLRFLLDSPEFELKLYNQRHDPALLPPLPVNSLPTGQDHRTLQYLLGTINIAEASYEDNYRLVSEWFSQLGWDTTVKRMEVTLKKVVAWIGDQLTMSRLRGLFNFHAEDENSFERLDFSIFVFGWLHCQMAFANSLHKQYLGTDLGRGLKHAFNLLERKGLHKVQTKGPFYHDLDECLHHVAEAHIHEDWLKIGGVEKLSDLRQHTPEQLKQAAKVLVQKRASNEALNKINDTLEDHRDEQLYQIIMWNRDVLQYITLNHAVKQGDVGLMEKMLPHLFLRFVGGGNGNYAVEVLELLQALNREWPQEIS